MLKFITGNKTKFKEASEIMSPLELEQVNIDLVEIQEIDPHIIIRHKLNEALKHQKGEFIVEDSGLFLECLDYKLPGPLIKWFNDTIAGDGLAHMTEKMGKNKARAITIVGYTQSSGDILFFEGVLDGVIVKPQGDYNFGYDPIFIPEGSTKTQAELKAEGNFNFSPRAIAMKKLKDFLLKK